MAGPFTSEGQRLGQIYRVSTSTRDRNTLLSFLMRFAVLQVKKKSHADLANNADT
jgi:hypothetical protein